MMTPKLKRATRLAGHFEGACVARAPPVLRSGSGCFRFRYARRARGGAIGCDAYDGAAGGEAPQGFPAQVVAPGGTTRRLLG